MVSISEHGEIVNEIAEGVLNHYSDKREYFKWALDKLHSFENILSENDLEVLDSWENYVKSVISNKDISIQDLYALIYLAPTKFLIIIGC
jgi:hypothetical protein